MKSKKHTIKQTIKRLILITLVICMIAPQAVLADDNIDREISSKIKLQAVLTPPYAIGPGDVLSVTDRTLRELFGQVETYNLTVSGDGYISIPLPDGTQENVLVAGYTLDEISAQIRELFGRTLKNPLVFVQISKYRPINVYIGGAVVKPGVYKIETTSTTEKGATTTSSNTFGVSLTEAIQLAGGMKPRADITNINIIRGSNSEKKIIDLKAFLLGELSSQDLNLQPGDSIHIPVAEASEDQAQNHVALLGKLAYQEVPVNVVGEVKTPGSFTLPNDATLLDAIGSAGGTNEVGSLKKIRISRYDEDGIYRTHKINVHDLIRKGIPFEKIALRPNDLIVFEASKGKETRHFLRDISGNTISILAGTAAGTFGGFLVQDSFFNRNARLARGKSSLPSQSLGGTQINILNRTNLNTNEGVK